MQKKTIICDCCKKDFSDANEAETQDFLHWENTGGYGAPFGDMTRVTLDLCNDCQIKIIGDYVHYPDGK